MATIQAARTEEANNSVRDIDSLTCYLHSEK